MCYNESNLVIFWVVQVNLYGTWYDKLVFWSTYFFTICLKDASEQSGLRPVLRILFHTIAPWYLMPVWLKFAEQEGTWRREAILVL